MIAPLFIALALFGFASGSWWSAALLAAAAAPTLATRARLDAGPATQRTALVVAAAIGIALGIAHDPAPGYGPGTLLAPAAAFAGAAFAVSAVRRWIGAPERGLALGFAIELAGVAACGLTRLGPAYDVGAAIFIAASLAGLRADDPARVPVAAMTARARVAAIALVAVALAGAASLVLALPPLYDWTQSRFDAAYQFIGFRNDLTLTALDDLKRSDEIVLRLDGPRTDYLRGAVYDRFDARSSSWALARKDMRTFALGAPRAPGAVEVRRVGGWGERYFLPLRAGAIGSPAGEANLDALGVMRPAGNRRYDRYWFDPTAPDALSASSPTADDAKVPDALRPLFERLVAEWTAPGDSPDVVLAKIARRFDEEYTYSVSFARPAADPLVDFLTANKQGNCEYFASAAALLARAAHVPARVATGYRVAERNPITEQYLVRQKNAHAWVEAWVDGEWRTFDPTPASRVEENLARDVSVGRALADLVTLGFAALGDWWARLGPVELGIAAGALTVLFVVVRALRARRASRVASAKEALEPPLPCFVRLGDALAARGVARAPSESLARWSSRLADAALADEAALVERYAALRYGGVGDADELARAIDLAAQRLRADAAPARVREPRP